MRSRYMLLVFIGLIIIAACQNMPGENDQLTPTTPFITLLPTNLPDQTQTVQPAHTATATVTREFPTEISTNTSIVTTVVTTPTQQTLTTPTETTAIIIDHNSIELFEQIPDEYVQAAQNLALVYMDASVGANIYQTFECFTANSWSTSPAHCRRDYYGQGWDWKTFNQSDLTNQLVSESILFEPNPIKYDYSNWEFKPMSGDWHELIQQFIEVSAPAVIDATDVISLKFNYLHVTPDSSINGQTAADGTYRPGFFDADPGNPKQWDVSDLVDLEIKHPDKVFVYWTTSLSRAIGSENATVFNEQMRAFARENGKVLFDLVDIEAHTPDNSVCVDARDGVCYCNNNQCEDYSAEGTGLTCDYDDGVEYAAICQDYTTETFGGHLGSVSAGKIRIAKAFWVLMARIAGWDSSPIP